MSTSKILQGALIAASLGALCAPVWAPIVLSSHAQTTTAASSISIDAQTTSVASSISIDNFTFNPQTLTVKAGTTVTWTNKDDIPHGIASANNAFSRGKAMDTDDSFSFTFTTPGTYQYFCYIHPHMTGTIVVQAATGSNATQ
jgi:plastocyanin